MSEADWASLPAAIRRRFSKRLAGGAHRRLCRRSAGNLDEPRRLVARAGGAADRRPAADRRAARMCRASSPSPRTRASGGQIWTRLYARRSGFPQVIHSAKRFAGPTGLEEYVGRGVGMSLTVVCARGRADLPQQGLFPAAASAAVSSCRAGSRPARIYVTHAELPDGKFSFTLQVIHPRFGLLIRQMAIFREVAAMTSLVLWTLIAVQLALGLFDILYHHELTERLAWRPSQRHELNLHGARNCIYAVLFLAARLLRAARPLGDAGDRGAGRRSRHHAAGFRRGGFEPQAAGDRARHPHAAGASTTAPSSRCWSRCWSAGPASRPRIVPVWYGIASVLAPLAARRRDRVRPARFPGGAARAAAAAAPMRPTWCGRCRRGSTC